MKNAARLLFAMGLALALGGCLENLNAPELSDSTIKTNIMTELKAQRGLDIRYVELDVHSGIVTVSGIATSFEEKDLIESIVKKSRGVDQAVINLVIQE